jgi:hypothetical protein
MSQHPWHCAACRRSGSWDSRVCWCWRRCPAHQRTMPASAPPTGAHPRSWCRRVRCLLKDHVLQVLRSTAGRAHALMTFWFQGHLVWHAGMLRGGWYWATSSRASTASPSSCRRICSASWTTARCDCGQQVIHVSYMCHHDVTQWRVSRSVHEKSSVHADLSPPAGGPGG